MSDPTPPIQAFDTTKAAVKLTKADRLLLTRLRHTAKTMREGALYFKERADTHERRAKCNELINAGMCVTDWCGQIERGNL